MIVVILAVLAIPGYDRFNLLRYWGSMVALILLGVAAGLFAVPIQVFLQTRPPESLKGRTRSVLERASKKLSSTRTLSRRKANSEK
jgi:hypothetical protein